MLTLAIPNRNGGKFLGHALDSLERNRPFVRWCLQDSCSTDDSLEIATRHAGPDDKIRVEKDKSQTEALNRAFSQMGGDIVGFLNSDDCLADGAAEAVLAAFRADPSVDIVCGEVEWIDEDGSSLGFHKGDISSLSEVLDIYGVWWGKKNWVQPEVFWRRSLWDRVGPFNEEFDLAFDYEYWVRCFAMGAKVHRLPRVLAKFRRHSAQKSMAATKAASEIRTIVQRRLTAGGGLDAGQRFRLRSRLSYDLYQSGLSPSSGLPFWRAILNMPHWALLPEFWERLRRSRLANRVRWRR